MKVFTKFLILSILTLLSLKLTSAACHVDDESGLLAFKSGITQDPTGILSSWRKGTDCCKWNGITCLTGDRVTAMWVSADSDNLKSYLSGTISPSLTKVKYLDGVYLLDLKNITGNFPIFLFELPNLKFLYIENNKLSGRLPVNIGKLSQLEALSLTGNRFRGAIPASISNLTKLDQLKLGNNLFTGKIPLGISKLKDLTYLNLENNQLSRQIPNFFSSFKNLLFLEISHNKFIGTIPSSISTLAPKLINLELGHNLLSGNIPSFLGNFQKLDTLDLSWNNLTGTVPKSFSNLTKIFNLDLSHNNLVDPFPLMNVKGIESLDLSYNHFHLNQIPSWVTSSTIIYSLKLARCGIKMDLTKWKPIETYFYDYIDLSENEITGSPVWLLNKTDYLVGFWASKNKLKFDLGSLRIPSTLKNLDLSSNLVYGKVPKNVTGLESLNLSYNHLCGQIPATKFPASSFVGNDCLCGSPLPPCKM